ncbi:sugar ABC transporter permease [Tessaracoccus sp. Z1128]
MARKLANGDNDVRLHGGRWWAQVGWKHVFGILVIAYCTFPLLYVLSASLNTNGTLTGSLRLFTSITGEHYAELMTTDYPRWALQSFYVSSVTAVGTVLMGAAAAYAFSRFRFKGRRGGLTALLIIQMFPQMLAFVAIFLLALTLGEIFPFLGVGSHLQLIAIYLGGALGANTFLMYGFFNTIPMELDEAAKIDGATHAQIFWGIIMRLVTPILAVVGLLSFVGSYGEFILAKIVLARPENYTLAVGLYVWGSDERNAPWSLFAAGAVLAAIPIIVLFMYLQRYIVAGLTAGGVKG